MKISRVDTPFRLLSRSGASGFHLEYITKLSTVKDTLTKKTLLHHIVRKVTTVSHKKIVFFTRYYGNLHV
jgi:hypothetical protein